MKKTVYVIAISVVIILFIVGMVFIHSKRIDKKYAVEYARVFGSYDINEVDRYLDKKTIITYNGFSSTYEDLRDNVISAFNEKKYDMPKDGSYGHGNGRFVDGTQTVEIQVYINSDDYSSEFVSMEIERKCFMFYRIKTISSDDDFFGYLFWGKNTLG